MSATAASTQGSGPPPGRFSVRTVALLILVGVFSMSALAVLSAYAPDLKKGDDGGGHALSSSAIGFAGTAQLLRNAGQPVLISRGPIGASRSEGLLILTPRPYQDPAAVVGVNYEGMILVVLPKWNVQPLAQKPSWVRPIDLIEPAGVLGPIVQERAKNQTELRRRTGVSSPVLSRPDGTQFARGLGSVSALQTISGPGWEPVVVDENGAAILAYSEPLSLYVLADPDLLNTHGLRDPDTALAAVRMLQEINHEGGPMILDVTLHGFSRPRSLLRMMLEPPLLGATLALLVAAALVAFQAAVRFGPTRHAERAIALGKRALADNSAGLVRLAGREHSMAGPYALLVRAAVTRAIGAPRNLDGAELDAFLDRLGATLWAGTAYTALAAEARAARTAGDLIRVARNLHRWKLEMTRGRQ